MTRTTAANAQALPDAPPFDRRAFLASMTAAGVMIGAAPVDVAGAPQGVDAKLLDFVAALFAAEARWLEMDRAAVDAGIFDACQAMKPAVPAALFFQAGQDTFEICRDPERLEWIDVDGERRRFYGEEDDVPSLRWAIGIWRREGTGRRVVDRGEEIIAALDVYVAGVKRAEELSGVAAFDEAFRQNQVLIDGLDQDIAAEPARTLEGIAAKAHVAARSWGGAESIAGTMLTDLLQNKGLFRGFVFRRELALAVSVVADAMKLAAPPASIREAV